MTLGVFVKEEENPQPSEMTCKCMDQPGTTAT